jgi:predicted transcriptional regulator
MASDDVELLKCLADQAALDIVRLLLVDGPARQRDLAARLDLSAVAVSRALASLERAGVVQCEGSRSPYELTFDEGVHTLVAAASDLSDYILRDKSERAKRRADELRKVRMSRRQHHDWGSGLE